MKRFYIEGKTNSGISFIGSVTDTDISSAIEQANNLGCEIYVIRLERTILNNTKHINIQIGEPKPEHVICGKCKHCHTLYREAARGFDDEKYYTCDLRKEGCSCVDYNGYCSNGVAVE